MTRIGSIFKYRGKKIFARQSDYYINLQSFSKASKVSLCDFLHSMDTESYFDALAERFTSIPSSQFIKFVSRTREGETTYHGWIHPQVAMSMAYKASARLQVTIFPWIQDLLMEISMLEH